MTESEAGDQRFPKTHRLLKTDEFQRVHRSPVFAADDVLVIKAIENGTSQSRLGLSISRRVGNAVVRNRWKRVIRESFRRQRSQLPTGLDLVVRPKKGAVCDSRAVWRSLGRLCQRIEKTLARQRKDRVPSGESSHDE